MCPPLILAGAALIGAGTAVAGTVVNANAQASAADFQEKQAIQNAHYAKQAEEDVLRQGEVEANKLRSQGEQLIGKQRVAYAASGIMTDSGSALDTVVETKALTELEAQTIKANAARDAWGYRTQGLNYVEQGKLARKAGNQAAIGSFLTGAGQLIGGVGQAASYFRN